MIMSPAQLNTLQQLSRLFEEGVAGPRQIKELSELLSTINHHQNIIELSEQEALIGFKSNFPLN